MSKGADQLAAGGDTDVVAQACAYQGIVNQDQGVVEGHTQAIDELQRGRAGTSLSSVDDDVVGMIATFQHGLDDGKPFPGMSQRQFDAHRFVTG